MKPLLLWIIGIACLGLALGLALVVFADKVLTRAINESGHRVLNVETHVDSCRLSLWKGSVALSGIELKNPEGFKSPRMVYLDRISLRLSPSSLLRDRVHVQEVEIEGAELTYEVVGFGRSNLSVFMEGLKRRSERNIPPLGGREEESHTKSVMIERIRVENGRVTLSAVFSRGRSIVMSLPSIELRDIGKDRPVSVSEAVSEVLRRLGRAALSTVDKEGASS